MVERFVEPGRAHRKGISWKQVMAMFDTEEKALAWFEKQRWPKGVRCVWCNNRSVKKYAQLVKGLSPYRCRACQRRFSVKTNSVMHRSHLPLSTWGLAIYAVTTGLKSVSSMKLHRDLGITQKSAWYMLHRIRESWNDSGARSGRPRRRRRRQLRTDAITLERARQGTFHHLSDKHLRSYLREFAGRHVIRPLDTDEQMGIVARMGVGKRLSYRDLIGPPEARLPAKGLIRPSRARHER